MKNILKVLIKQEVAQGIVDKIKGIFKPKPKKKDDDGNK